MHNVRRGVTLTLFFISLGVLASGCPSTTPRFVDNGDGTVTDNDTGLMWERKSDAPGIHHKDDAYTWTASGTAPDGTAFTIFLGGLNDCESSDGSTISGGFAGYCDWRLPDIGELQTIMLEPPEWGTSLCIDPAFGPTAADGYWSSVTTPGNPGTALGVNFDNAFLYITHVKTTGMYVRAVRGGS